MSSSSAKAAVSIPSDETAAAAEIIVEKFVADDPGPGDRGPLHRRAARPHLHGRIGNSRIRATAPPSTPSATNG